jgi:Ran GTPase-activating protein (RanGAP) involved in mRNA processing and transport
MVKEVVQRAIGQMREGKNELVPKNMLINKKLDAEDAGAIAEELKVNKSLTTLGLDHNAIGASGASSIGEALKVNGSLTSLHLLQNSIGDPGASSIGEALKDNQSLTELDLGANSIGASGASSIGEALKDNASLTELNLRGNSIGAPGASSIGEALKVNRSLTDLDLALNSIGDPGGSSIGEALKVNGSLTELSLFRNEIGDPGAFSIGEALKVNASLTVLSLGANSIGGPGASSIGEALKDNRSLTELDLSDNDIEDPAEATDATCILAGLLSSANLVTLDVRDNKLTRIPADAFLRCTKLAAPVDSYGDTINPFSSNPWTHPPAEIVDQGLEAVREYLQRIQSEGAERCAVAKMMLVGLGEAGKTSFLNAIRSADGKSASIDRADRTVGIDLHAWEPDTATLEAALGAERAGTLAGLRINACDMAGQDEYGVTHQLFLTPRSFYVLVFDAKRAHDDGESREARQDSVDRWLESIQARSPAAQVRGGKGGGIPTRERFDVHNTTLNTFITLPPPPSRASAPLPHRYSLWRRTWTSSPPTKPTLCARSWRHTWPRGSVRCGWRVWCRLRVPPRPSSLATQTTRVPVAILDPTPRS